MNWDAFRERVHNRRYIFGVSRKDKFVLEVERKNVTFRGRKWIDLSDYDKRKFENQLYMDNANKGVLKVLYV